MQKIVLRIQRGAMTHRELLLANKPNLIRKVYAVQHGPAEPNLKTLLEQLLKGKK